MRSRNSPVVVAGDSMMRQFFLRLVMMMRGQKRLVDYHQHAHAMYAVCREADVFRLSTNNRNETSVSPNDGYLIDKIGPFFGVRGGPGTLMARAAMSKCSRSPAQFHYMHLPTFDQQTKGLKEYLRSTGAAMVKPIYLVSVGYWTHADSVPQDYLDALEVLAETGSKVIVVSVPTVRVVDEDHRRAYAARNAFMKAWVTDKTTDTTADKTAAAAGEKIGDDEEDLDLDHLGPPTTTNTKTKFAFLDYDALSLADHPPPGGADNNWHYMCAIAWLRNVRVDHSPEGMNEFGEPVSQIYQGKVERVMSTEDETCGDEMNRMLWQVAWNMIL
jgi:hypothetical protein